MSLGYAYLNRIAPGAGGLDDILEYSRMAQFDREVDAPFRYRPLVPWAAGALVPILSRLPLGSWDATALAFLLVGSLLTAAATCGIRQIALQIGFSSLQALIACFLFLTSFSVSNVYLAGFVDAFEVAALVGIALAALTQRFPILLLLMIVAPWGKESCVVFGSIYCAVLLPQRKRWIVAALAALASLIVVRWTFADVGWWDDLWTYRRPTTFLQRWWGVLTAKSLLYTFALPLLLGVPRWRSLPVGLRRAAILAAIAALVLAGIAGIENNVSRPLYNVSGWVLALAGARTLAGNDD